MTRTYHLILLGATGFTGRLVAEYLLQTYGVDKDLKWAMAGRNMEKLKKIRSELGNENIPLLQADSLDPASLDALTQQTKVLCTTVGPYAKYGSETVASCVRSGTHYCDLTGEVQWMRRMIDTHHEEAQQKKVKIVHCCGFDSIPSDMGVFFFQKEAKSKTGSYCQHIKTGLKASSGGFSGGTVASLLYVLEEAEKDKSIYKVLSNPYGLNPEGAQDGPDQNDPRSVNFDEHLQRWRGPFVMAFINTKIVRRSHALLDFPYGKDFRYEEFFLSGKGFSGRLKGIIAASFLGLLTKAKPGSFTKKLLDWFAPKPGQGPSQKQRENGFFVFDQVGIFSNGTVLRGSVKGDRDPGYGSTSKMLAEAAVCLAKDELHANYGVITPSVAMGDALLKRLQENAGLSFEIKSTN